MMQMFQKTGEFRPDSLIVSPDYPILTEGIGLKAGQGLLRRGSLIMKGADKAGYIAGADASSGEGTSTGMKVFGILTDDFDTGEDASAGNVPATAYQTGEFNRAAVLVSGESTAVETYEDEMRGAGIYLRSVQNYG